MKKISWTWSNCYVSCSINSKKNYFHVLSRIFWSFNYFDYEDYIFDGQKIACSNDNEDKMPIAICTQDPVIHHQTSQNISTSKVHL